jgi:cytidine deaminase
MKLAPVISAKLRSKALSAAKRARNHSYSPYSHCKVGAAIITSDLKIYSGCNVENSSYGATICAERSAIASAVSNEGHITIRAVIVVTDATPAWPPCGVCRQVLAEMSQPETSVECINLQGKSRMFSFAELLPAAFTSEHLNLSTKRPKK